ncbi:MAG: hypothetical protein CMF45_02920 [Legionellales bacterium]|nr:hypothetical protein [Legionellales bacterium]
MFIMPYLIIIAVAIWFFVFKPAADEESYNKGYDDGHVVGWNKICAPNKTNLIYGEWEDKKYSEGYYDGEYDGEYEAKQSKC